MNPRKCVFCLFGCVQLLMSQENQTELNKRRHSHPSQSLPIAGDDRQNADTALLSNWIWDIIYSCINMSGKSCGNNTHSLTFVLSLSPFSDSWMDGEVKCDLIQILCSLSLRRTHTVKHQHSEKPTTNSVWKPISVIHCSFYLPVFACLMVLIPHLHPDKKQSLAFWKLITSDGQLSAALKEHACFFCRVKWED